MVGGHDRASGRALADRLPKLFYVDHCRSIRYHFHRERVFFLAASLTADVEMRVLAGQDQIACVCKAQLLKF
jgi:hypothetical protein